MNQKVPDWFNDSDFDFEPVIVFKTNPIHVVKFLNEGEKGYVNIPTKEKDKEGNTLSKKVACVNYLVEEDGEEKTFNPIAKNTINSLKELFPLKNRTFRIELRKGRTDFENEYLITEVK